MQFRAVEDEGRIAERKPLEVERADLAAGSGGGCGAQHLDGERAGEVLGRCQRELVDRAGMDREAAGVGDLLKSCEEGRIVRHGQAVGDPDDFGIRRRAQEGLDAGQMGATVRRMRLQGESAQPVKRGAGFGKGDLGRVLGKADERDRAAFAGGGGDA